VVFNRAVIAEYIDAGCNHISPASRGNRRSKLLRMAELLLPPDQRVLRLVPLPSADASAPYSSADITMLRGWATGQNTVHRTQGAHVLLFLGLGAGLSTSEIANAKVEDVTFDDQGTLVAVTGARKRIVPVLAEWENVLEGLTAQRAGAEFLFRPNRTSSYVNLVSNFVARTAGTQIRPTPGRMRATWIVNHLTAGTPIPALVEAAGVESLEPFTRYLKFVPGINLTEARKAMRLQVRNR